MPKPKPAPVSVPASASELSPLGPAATTDMTSTEYLRDMDRDRDRDRTNLARPLSEISENESRRRASASASASASNRSSMHSKKSRPASEVKEAERNPTTTTTTAPTHSPTTMTNGSSATPQNVKRMSSAPVQTITVNLLEYAKSRSAQQPTHAFSTTTTTTNLTAPRASSAGAGAGDDAPPPPSPTSKPAPPELPKRPAEADKEKEKGRVVSSSSTASNKGKEREEGGDESDSSRPGVSSFLQARRASLRPSSLSISYADVAKPISFPPATATSASVSATAFESLESLSLRSTSVDIPSDPATKPATKSKPSWLRRASGTAALRTKSRTPPPKEDTATTSTSLPPALPPRRGLEPMAEVPSSQSLPEQGMAPPPFPPRKTSYANAASVAGSSRSRLGEGQGRPAFSPSTSASGFTQPPPLPPRENMGNIRGRIAAWTAAAQTSGSFNRSESSSSLASQAGSPQQRFPASAQRVLGHAGSAVQKGWAGLRSRGVGGSISSMSSLGQSSRRGFEPSPSWSSGLASKGRDRTHSDNFDFGPGSSFGPGGSDGPVFEDGSIKRAGQNGTGRVFGREVVDVGKEWGVADAGSSAEGGGQTEWETRRRKCLPAVVVRSVEYLEIWGPKEEGIFRISGRSSHITRLRKEFDSGADIDLKLCHPGDLDPHAVAGLFKSYLRELPSPLLTHHLSPRFDAYIRGKGKTSKTTNNRSTIDSMAADDGHFDEPHNLKSLLQELPQAHWFLLADIVKLLDLIPRHSSTNRMTLNALMLSLGPSLNISGGVLNELIENRETLFAVPPEPSFTETTADLIDFGDTPIPPVLSELSTRSITPASQLEDGQSAGVPSLAGSTRSKRPPRLPAKPSLSKIFGHSMTSIPRQKSVDTLNSIISTEPPRVDLPESVSGTSPLPTFEKDTPTPGSTPTPKPAISSVSGYDPAAPSETALPSGSEKTEEVHYPIGTVDERARAFSTPIADRFQGTSSPFPSLRSAPRSSDGSNISNAASEGNLAKAAASGGEHSLNLHTNPATVIRRGPPVFFQSAGVGAGERHSNHGHTRSVSSVTALLNSPALSDASASASTTKDGENADADSDQDAGAGAGTDGPTGVSAGQKRKDDGDLRRENGNGADEEGRAKRLSAGPGVLG